MNRLCSLLLMEPLKSNWPSVTIVAQSDLTNDYIPRTAQRKKSENCAQIKIHSNTYADFVFLVVRKNVIRCFKW